MISESQQILQSAESRSVHFANSIHWFSSTIKSDVEFQKNFLYLTEQLSLCARNSNEPKQAFFLAVGKSAQVANLIASMLISVGILARFIHPTEAFHGDFGVIGKNDLVIFISNNGSSNELLQLFPGLIEREAKTIAITSKCDSPLSQFCQITLQIPPYDEMCPLAQAPLTSSITSLALGQLLVAATIEKRNFSLQDYAKNHPGGAIGRRIFLKVDDLMLKGKNIPIISPLAPFSEVVSTFTRYSKGALLVVENNLLLGLISEKDLRTAMEMHQKNVFDICAQNLMNPCPTTTNLGLLAIDVKNMMTSKNPPLNVLPVVDNQKNVVGLIRLLDFLSAGL